jgi:hypothetical protein
MMRGSALTFCANERGATATSAPIADSIERSSRREKKDDSVHRPAIRLFAETFRGLTIFSPSRRSLWRRTWRDFSVIDKVYVDTMSETLRCQGAYPGV